MQRSILWVLIAFMAVSCNQTEKKESGNQEAVNTEKIVSATIVELLAAPADYQDKEVAVSGMVTHVCRHGGQKCFIVAEDGETQIRIVPGGEIDEFKVEIEGSTALRCPTRSASVMTGCILISMQRRGNKSGPAWLRTAWSRR